MVEDTLERRVTALERELEALKQRVTNDERKWNWIDRVSGSMSDMPEFDEVIELGKQMRKATGSAGSEGPVKQNVA